MKTMITLLAMVFGFVSLADTTPIQQALEIQQHIINIKQAIQNRGVECTDLASFPEAISRITDVSEFVSGRFNGSMILDNQTINYSPFKKVNGNYTVYAPNLTSIDSDIFNTSYGLNAIYAPLCSTLSSAVFINCPNLKHVYLPECQNTYDSLFCDCNSLIDVDISKCSSIKYRTFLNCKNLKSVKTKPLTFVDTSAFQDCQSLTNIVFSPTCQFSENAFQRCYSLKAELPKNFNNFSHKMFEDCRSLENIDLSEEDQVFIDSNCIFNGCSGVTNLNLGSIQTLCGDYMFANLGVTNIYGGSIENIGIENNMAVGVFGNNSKLKSISFPKLKQITYNSDSTYLGVFQNCVQLEDVDMPELEIVGKIGTNDKKSNYLFSGCTNLKSIELPKLQELNGRRAFAECISLTNVVMPSLRVINNADYDQPTFVRCRSLKRIYLPNLETISYSYNMFYECYNLEEVLFPKLTNIWYSYNSNRGMPQMFIYCTKLRNVTFGYTANNLLNGLGDFPGNAPLQTVFHCMGDAPYNVDVVYRNNKWQAVTNGTYKLVDYIKATGTQYLDSGVIYDTNTVVEMDCSIEDGTQQYETLFGSSRTFINQNDMHACYRFNHEKKFSYCRTNSETIGSTYDNGEYHIVATNDMMCVYNTDGQLIQKITVTGPQDCGASTLAIFTTNLSPYTNGFSPDSPSNAKSMKLYRFKVYKNGELQCDLVPALVNDSIPCVVDLAHNYTPHFNYGSGEFEYGSVTNDIIKVENQL